MRAELQIETTQKRRKTEQSMEVHILPQTIIYDILLKIPAEILVTFKSVCKSWYKLISDRDFVYAHLDLHRGDFQQILVLNGPESEYQLSHLQEEAKGLKFQLGHNKLQNFVKDELYISSFCNGLLLLHSRNNRKQLYLCNPVTRKCTKYPILKTDPLVDIWNWNLIYDSSIQNYKVVVVSTSYSDRKWFLFTPPTRSYNSSNEGNVEQTKNATAAHWRELLTPYQESHFLLVPTSLNNELFWLSSPANINKVLFCSMDVSKEEFGETHISFLPKRDWCTNTIMEVMGALSITEYIRKDNQLDIWILQDRKKGLWTKKYTVNCEFKISRNVPLCSYPSRTSSEQTRILTCRKDQIFFYDLKNADGWKIMDFMVHEDAMVLGRFLHTNSLIKWD